MNNQKKKIVIVDDEASFLMIFSKVLEREGFEVVGFTSPKEALIKIVEEKPSLVILDIRMTEMDGFEIFKHLKTDLRENLPKIMFLTNIGETISGEEINENFIQTIGGQGYIRKSDDLDKIVSKVKQALIT